LVAELVASQVVPRVLRAFTAQQNGQAGPSIADGKRIVTATGANAQDAERRIDDFDLVAALARADASDVGVNVAQTNRVAEFPAAAQERENFGASVGQIDPIRVLAAVDNRRHANVRSIEGEMIFAVAQTNHQISTDAQGRTNTVSVGGELR
jgi:hypothetical protein